MVARSVINLLPTNRTDEDARISELSEEEENDQEKDKELKRDEEENGRDNEIEWSSVKRRG